LPILIHQKEVQAVTDIIKQGAQILTPDEYEKMREHLNPKHRLLFDGMLFTGMRIEEFWRFVSNPQWFHAERQYVELPPGSILKIKAKQRERLVMLSNIGTRAMMDLVSAIKRKEIEHITPAGWRQNVTRAAAKAGLDPKGITPKMLRKTWVSWLMAAYPEDGLRVASSAGHDIRTMQVHYLSLPFSNVERERIRFYVIGRGGRN